MCLRHRCMGFQSPLQLDTLVGRLPQRWNVFGREVHRLAAFGYYRLLDGLQQLALLQLINKGAIIMEPP